MPICTEPSTADVLALLKRLAVINRSDLFPSHPFGEINGAKALGRRKALFRGIGEIGVGLRGAAGFSGLADPGDQRRAHPRRRGDGVKKEGQDQEKSFHGFTQVQPLKRFINWEVLSIKYFGGRS
jgi:hypothetical protein